MALSVIDTGVDVVEGYKAGWVGGVENNVFVEECAGPRKTLLLSCRR